MNVDEALIEKVASNARLNLTDEEKKRYVPQFKEILESFSKLDEIDVANTRLSVHPIKMKDRLRDDKPEDCLTQDEALENAKRKKDGFFKGPKAV